MSAWAFSFSSHTSYHCRDITERLLLWHKTTTTTKQTIRAYAIWWCPLTFLPFHTPLYVLTVILPPAALPDTPAFSTHPPLLWCFVLFVLFSLLSLCTIHHKVESSVGGGGSLPPLQNKTPPFYTSSLSLSFPLTVYLYIMHTHTKTHHTAQHKTTHIHLVCYFLLLNSLYVTHSFIHSFTHSRPLHT